MGDKTNIEWTDATWNPMVAFNVETGKRGHWCVTVSEGCRFCYASRMNETAYPVGTGISYKAQNRDKVRLELHQPTIEKMLRSGKQGRVFVCSMTDLFLKDHSDEWLITVFAVMALCQKKTFQVLTKRIERAVQFMNAGYTQEAIWNEMSRLINAYHLKDRYVYAVWPLPNVWIGTSVEDQKSADERIPHLLRVPAVVRFLSCEPLLGKLDLRDYLGWHCSDIPEDMQIQWLICGGESGPNARPMHPDWARSLRDQCEAAGVPFLFKQWGEYLHESQFSDMKTSMDPDTWEHLASPVGVPNRLQYKKVGKKAAGRLLDGVQHDGYPTPE
jgi:protein gp37